MLDEYASYWATAGYKTGDSLAKQLRVMIGIRLLNEAKALNPRIDSLYLHMGDSYREIRLLQRQALS